VGFAKFPVSENPVYQDLTHLRLKVVPHKTALLVSNHQQNIFASVCSIASKLTVGLPEVDMLQESGTGTWDLRSMWGGPSVGFKLFIWFVLGTWVAAIIKQMRIWGAAPPFRRSRQLDSPEYARTLQTTSSSLRQWIGLTLILWGGCVSVRASSTCLRLYSEKVHASLEILAATTECFTALNLALFTVTLLYLLRWHVEKRIESLHDSKTTEGVRNSA
jgi:hypothetical protein